MRIPSGLEYYPAQSKMPAHLEQRLRELAFRFGDSYASYLVTDDGWDTLWSQNAQGVVRFTRWGGCYAMVVGGLLAPPEVQGQLLADFLHLAKVNRWHVAFYNVDRQRLPLFRQHGMEVTKFGEDPVVRLDKTTWEGKDYEWIRRQENFCKRQGMKLVEVDPDPSHWLYREEIVPRIGEDLARAHHRNPARSGTAVFRRPL